MDTQRIQKLWDIASEEWDELKKIEHIIRSQESVEDVLAVLRHAELDQDAEIVAFVTLRRLSTVNHNETKEQNRQDHELQRVQFWDSYWNGYTYLAMEDIEPNAMGRDFVGWTSMYDGSELNKVEMNEWLDETITAILDGGTGLHVLEIGTGSGMILFNLINDAHSYVGLEMSQTAVEFIDKTTRSRPSWVHRIHMYKATAADLGSLKLPTSPDVVVVNSVAQYFPSQEYLLQVVESVLQLGTVRTLFFGDIRSYALYKEFSVSKVLYSAGQKVNKRLLREKIAEIAQQELELLVDPAFFTCLPHRFPDLVDHVEIIPKRMRATNELSCYRYAAVLHLRCPNQTTHRQDIHNIRNDEWIDFSQQGLDHKDLLQRLETSPRVLAVSNITYSKTNFERNVVDSLEDYEQSTTLEGDNWLSSIRERAQNQPSLSALDLQEIAKQAGYRVEISWARQNSQRGGLDAIFHKYSVNRRGRVLFQFPSDHEGRESHSLTNQPLLQQVKHMVEEQLNETLESQLPAHAIPEKIIIVDKLPINDGRWDLKL
ncbi:hypothetical protein BKA67DRAFT_596032 [Truncatella angustata]|uniref:Methyltransferase domain-containing protein n=1 Tax=Truncatella angustata TaxID=152316 RepID=A0A9P8RFX4_9PEZI|nr:uncharacterized protein BKA67DRAFT_596032 [Truncatella angustata]KAH6645132.1 hypothetical protein BKA67DRAFT_596032 [Truncatella angustata]